MTDQVRSYETPPAARLLLALLALACAPRLAVAAGDPVAAAEPPRLPILCYHDVRDDVVGDLDPDEHAVSTRALVEQFDWLLAHDYTPVTVSQVLDAERGIAPLPPRPVLLTFDDGYASFYHRVLPLLRAYEFPAVLSVVGSWLEVPPEGLVDYGSRQVPRSRFLTWEQLQEISASPWVEIASHSWNLHRGLVGNPQGNTQPAANTRARAALGSGVPTDVETGLLTGHEIAVETIDVETIDVETIDVETIEEMQERVRRDLAKNRALLAERLGRVGPAPRLMVWPYGEAAGWAFSAARDLGFEASLLLGDEIATLDGRHAWQRILVAENPSLSKWVWQLRAPAVAQPVRALRVRLADLAGEDEARLSRLLETVTRLGVGAVYLETGIGVAGRRFTDLANRVAWQLRTRGAVHVWLSLPASLPPADLVRWASRVPVRGWLLRGDALERGTVERAAVERAAVERAAVERAAVERAAVERARAILAEYRTTARLAVTAPSLDEALAYLESPASPSRALEIDHVVLSPLGLELGDLPDGLAPSRRHRMVWSFGTAPEAARLAAFQGRGFLSLSISLEIADLDGAGPPSPAVSSRLDALRRWISSSTFPYPRP